MTLFVPLSCETPSPSSTKDGSRLARGVPTTLKQPKDYKRQLERAAQTVAKAKRVVVVCGAGISVQAGIPDFRSSTGLFHQLKKEHPKESLSSGRELFDAHHVFHSESTASIFYKMVARLASLAEQAAPTPFHEMLKSLDNRGQLIRCYTQNIDGIEERAGLTFGVPPIITRQSPKKSVKKSVKKEEEAKAVAASSEEAVNEAPATSPTTALATVSLTPVSLLPPLSTTHPSTSPTQRAGPSIDRTPRCIPLHGTLKSIHCASCGSTSPLSQHTSLLSQGFAPACVQCSEFEHTRQLVGKRLRGVGIMRPSIVLYNEDHREGESVGDVVKKDLTGGRTKRAPPDLLIVAGTSLKVPGTKRIVKEFSKAARSGIRRTARRQNTRGTGSVTPPKSSSGGGLRRGKKASSGEDNSAEGEGEDDEEEAEEEEESGEDEGGDESSEESEDEEERPIRTIYLNLDFPVPSKEWESIFDVWVQGDVQEFAGLVKSAMNTENKQRAGRRSARLGAAAAAAATNNKAAMSDKPVSPVLSTRTSAKRKRGTTDDEQKMEMDDKSVPVTPLESPVLEGEPVGGNQEALLRSTATLSISDDLDMENGNSKRRKIIPLAIDNSDPFDGVSAQQRHRGFVPVSPVDGDEKYPYSSLPHTHLQQRPMLGERRVSTLSSLLLPQENESKAGQGRMYTDRSRDDQRLSTANTSQTERYRPTLTPPPPAASSYPILPSFQTLLDVASPKKQSYRPRREDDHRTHREWNSGRHESRHQPLPHPHRHHDGNPQPQTQHSHASHRPHSQYSHPSHHPQHPNHSHYPQYHGYSQQQQHHYQHPHHPHHHHHEHSNLTSFPPSRDHQTSAKQAKRRQTISYQYSSSASDDAILTSFAPPARHPHVGGGRTVAPIRKQPWAHGSRSSELRFESVENMRWRGSGGGGIGDHGHGHGHGHGRTKSTASSTSSQRMMIDTHV